MPAVGAVHPGSVSYTGSHAASCATSPGISVSSTPRHRYDVQTWSSGSPSRTSSLVNASAFNPFTRTAYRTATASYQPQRRGRPVTAPNSCPLSRSRFPRSPVNSVGNGPSPTRVVYALAAPRTPSMARGPTPNPVHTPPMVAFDEVTYG